MVFLNLSMGDATLLKTANQTILFDTGPAEMAPRTIRALQARGISRINLLILSSNDPAFVSATPLILQQFPTDEIWINGVDYNDNVWATIQPYLEANKTRVVSYGDSDSWGALKLEVINPAKPLILTSPDADSIALKASYGSFCALLFSDSLAAGASGADAGTVAGGVDSKIVSGSIPIACPVMKVSHHGSANAASFQLLQASKPQDAIISVGPNLPESLYPQPALLRRLVLRNASVWTTDRLGDITVGSNGTGYEISSQRLRDSKYGQFIENVVSRGASYWGVQPRTNAR
ncbi:Uncharacterised protein [uncultured archaeon]|nr:Uncharacterised protein [uncultured archaeon]